jgi:hypothetical protein
MTPEKREPEPMTITPTATPSGCLAEDYEQARERGEHVRVVETGSGGWETTIHPCWCGITHLEPEIREIHVTTTIVVEGDMVTKIPESVKSILKQRSGSLTHNINEYKEDIAAKEKELIELKIVLKRLVEARHDIENFLDNESISNKSSNISMVCQDNNHELCQGYGCFCGCHFFNKTSSPNIGKGCSAGNHDGCQGCGCWCQRHKDDPILHPAAPSIFNVHVCPSISHTIVSGVHGLRLCVMCGLTPKSSEWDKSCQGKVKGMKC